MIAGGYADHTSWLLLFALFVVHGAGALSLDALVDRRLRARFPQLDGKPAFSLDGPAARGDRRRRLRRHRLRGGAGAARGSRSR